MLKNGKFFKNKNWNPGLRNIPQKINFLIVGHPIELYYVSKIKHWTEAIFIHLKLCGWLRQFEV